MGGPGCPTDFAAKFATVMDGATSDAEALIGSKGAADSPKSFQAKPLTRTKSDLARTKDYLQGFKNLPEDSPIKQGLACFLKWGVKPLIIVTMAYIWLFKQLYKVYKLLPTNLLQIIFGVGLCFFGGVYFTAIAAAEAALNFGGADMWDHLKTCYEEGAQIADANNIDDKVDDNKDNIPDVQQISANELLNRKAKVAMMAVKEPMKLQQALVALGNVYIAVIATLKFQFAQTVAIALGVASMLSSIVAKIFGPTLCYVMGPDLNHWVPAIIDTTVKVIAVVVATYVQAIISAFYSGLRGGRIVAVGLINILSERGCMDKLPSCIVDKPFDPDKSYWDEIIGYPIAAAGFYVQFTHGFTLDFPWNLICLPLTIVEWFLRFQVYT